MATTNLDALELSSTLAVTGAATFTAAIAANGGITGDVTGELVTFPVTTRTATAAPGGTTGVIADGGGALQIISVTSDDANKVITLPAPVPGNIVVLINGATGYEIRSSAPTTVLINGGTGGANVESAVAASYIVILVCTSATTWIGVAVAQSTVEAAA